MTGFVAVAAGDTRSIGVLVLLLGTVLGNVANLLAVVANGLAIVDGLASVVKTIEDLVDGPRPTVFLTRSLRVLREAVRNGELLAHVALKIHVGEGRKKLSLESDEPKADLAIDQAFLDRTVGRSTILSLDVFLECFLGIVGITLTSRHSKLLPSLLGRHVGDLVPVDLPGIGAVTLVVTY